MMMNSCGYQQQQKMNVLVGYVGEMRRGDSPLDGVVCPKPRRLGISIPSIKDHARPSRWHHKHVNHHTEAWELKTGTELGIIFTKGSYGTEKSIFQEASSPPFFCGSPPTRASNPVIKDAKFSNYKVSPSSSVNKGSPSSSTHKNGGCFRPKYGHNPAIRVEGFNCRGIQAV